MLITSITMVQKNFHRDLGTKWVDEQFPLKKFFQTGPTRGLILWLRSRNNWFLSSFSLICMKQKHWSPEYWIQHCNLLYVWKLRLQRPKMRAWVGPVWKFFFSGNCSSTHFVPKSLWKFFLDHYYGSYEHLIIADCLRVSPLQSFILNHSEQVFTSMKM